MTTFMRNRSNPQIHFDNVEQMVEHASTLADNNLGDFRSFARRPNRALESMEGWRQSNSELLPWLGGLTGNEVKVRLENRICDKTTQDSIRKGTKTMFKSTEFVDVEGMNMYHDECGLMLDTNAYFQGEEMNMINIDMVQSVKPIIWIACSVGASCNQGNAYFINRGIALIKTVHALERAGVSVGLVGYSISKDSDSGDRSVITTVIKQPENSLDEATLINVFAHAGVFRIFFIFYLHMFITCNGCGVPTNAKKEDIPMAKGNKVVILPHEGDFTNADKAFDRIVNQIKRDTNVIV